MLPLFPSYNTDRGYSTDTGENNPNSQRTSEQQRRRSLALEVHRTQLSILDSQPTLRTSEATPGLLFVSNLAEVRASLVTQMVKNLLPAVWETQGRSLGQEDPLEKKAARHSSILAWEIPWTEIQNCSSFGLPSC